MTKIRLEKEAQERSQLEAQQKTEVTRKHEMRLLQENELRTGIRRNPYVSPNIVNSDKAKLNMQKKK